MSSTVEFYPGIHQPSDTRHFERCFVSINRLKTRKADLEIRKWIMDSGAFSELNIHGYFTLGIPEYAAHIARWSKCGELVAACTQDFMCESFMFKDQNNDPDEWREYMLHEGANPNWFDDQDFQPPAPIGVLDHQKWTVERYGQLVAAVEALGCDTYIMPVLQGYTPDEYLQCIDLYEEAGHLPHGAYVGVGSVCKRNVNPGTVVEVLGTIKHRRPDLQLHGFGLKITAISDPAVRALLKSADSMAWSTAARHERNRVRKVGGDLTSAPSPNDWRVAQAYTEKIQLLQQS